MKFVVKNLFLQGLIMGIVFALQNAVMLTQQRIIVKIKFAFTVKKNFLHLKILTFNIVQRLALIERVGISGKQKIVKKKFALFAEVNLFPIALQENIAHAPVL